MMTSSKPLVVFGSFGFGNVGDEAVPYAVEDLLSSTPEEYQISVVSRFDSPRLQNVLGLSDRYAKQHAEFIEAPVIICGGGIIEPREMCCALRFGKYLKTHDPLKSSIFAGSFEFGVDYGWSVKRKLRRVFSTLDRIYTRDFISELYLRENFPELEVTTVGDIVLGLRAPDLRSFAVEYGNKSYITVCLSSAWSNSAEWYEWIAKELQVLSNDLDMPLLFVPMSCDKSDDDRVEHQKVISKIKSLRPIHDPVAIEQVMSPRDMAAVFRDSLLVISMRLHGCVMSYGQMTPFVGLSYHPKLSGFAKTVGWQHFVVPHTDLPIRQDLGQYGYAFSSLHLRPGDLCRVSGQALEFGSFNLLPLFKEGLEQSLKNWLIG